MMTTTLRLFTVLVFSASSISDVAGDFGPTFARCCAKGANHAQERVNCSSVSTLQDLPSEYQEVCTTVAEICCRRSRREKQCQLGYAAAYGGQECLAQEDEGGEYFKDCCEGCKLGLLSGNAGMGCILRGFDFGHPWDVVFLRCCKETSSDFVPSDPSEYGAEDDRSSGTVRTGDHVLEPSIIEAIENIPDSANLCKLFPGQLCSHVCVPTPGSYRCLCRAGFTLSIDGKTCVQDEFSDRCHKNNPCDHVCHDTGVSIECSCYPGYYLSTDQRTCYDINECELAIYSCSLEQKCYNQIGNYACMNRDGTLSTPRQGFSPGTEADYLAPDAISSQDNRLEPDLLLRQSRCPIGYKYSIESLVCDDIDECEIVPNICGQDGACQNTIGSFSCILFPHLDCPPGYKYDAEMQSCLDVDECTLDKDDCDDDKHFCLNTQGGFVCEVKLSPTTCPAGFKYNGVLRSCEDVDECAEQLHGCNPEEEECQNTIGAYECHTKCDSGFEYNPGFRSCVDIDECVKDSHDCDPETQMCVNEVGQFRCESIATEAPSPGGRLGGLSKEALAKECLLGYAFHGPSNACLDIDECSTIEHNCTGADERCINTLGSYSCQKVLCRAGYKRSPATGRCVDIDECSLGLSSCSLGETCMNSDGSFRCQVECKEGFIFNATDQSVCADIDECLEQPCGTEEECLNTEGSFQCLRPTSPPKVECQEGYEVDPFTNSCVDVDECLTGRDSCHSEIEDCVNRDGGFSCRMRECPRGYERSPNSFRCEDIDECQDAPAACPQLDRECLNTPGSFRCRAAPPCPGGFVRSNATRRCVDLDECSVGTHDCKQGERCVNQYGKYACRPSSPPEGQRTGYRCHPTNGKCEDIDECAEDVDSCQPNQVCINTVGSYACVRRQPTCDSGYEYNSQLRVCVDYDECSNSLNYCDKESELCVNLPGGYRCDKVTTSTSTPLTTPKPPQCPHGYLYNSVQRSCGDINECENFPCRPEIEICINTQGSFLCSCQDGFKRKSADGQCADINECQLGLHKCEESQRCDNTIGSYLCIRTASCGTGYTLNHNTGECEDINECIEGAPPCKRNQDCINVEGSYRCQDKIRCSPGYEMNELGTQCTDIDECEDGSHQCSPGQTCTNRRGAYVCQCPEGYRLNSRRECEDIDECQSYYGSVCSRNADCQNTPGSFACICKEGFRKDQTQETCIDINECDEIPGICHHNCINLWGSYHCSCNAGYILTTDNRTCSDVDECEELKARGRLCIGFCQNTPGSFRCECPRGYVLAADERTCKDLNECEEPQACEGDEICVNTRGDHKCNRIDCPPNYTLDPQYKNRCKRNNTRCHKYDLECLREPLSYSYNFLPLVSNLTLPSTGQVDIFTMRGPRWSSTTVHFHLSLESVRAPLGVEEARRDHFLLKHAQLNQAIIAIVRPLLGPQELELSLNMKLYQEGKFGGAAVAKLKIYVSEHDF